MKTKISLFIGLNLLWTAFIFGQMDDYNYKRKIIGINNQWHQLDLPETMYNKINPNFSDLRIFGITSEKDTIEAPYILKIGSALVEKENATFKVINRSMTKDGQYFTFELSTPTPINQIHLDLAQTNFDWMLKLEGSQNQKEWFTIKDKYRIVSIKNQLTDYQFATLNFPTAKYNFYRILVKTSKVVTLNKAQLDLQKGNTANYLSYPVIGQNIEQNKAQKATIVNIELANAVPFSFLKIAVAENYDFYRPITIQYLRDSIQTEKGWRHQYQTIESNILSSLDENVFTFESVLAKKLKIIIRNQDNPPLSISSIVVKGYEHQLFARFTKTADYFLTYGRKNATKPRYDIAQFANKIPNDLTTITLAAEQVIPKDNTAKNEPLFANKWWLWALMGLIILVLGGFTLKMLKEQPF